MRFRLQDIGRISFSRDLPVHDLVREWTLMDAVTLEARLEMETLTHPMQEHTFVRYKKIYPSTAWGVNEQNELHAEYGFLAVREGSNEIALTTVMNNGFTTVEEGNVNGNHMRFRLQDIGRISFSRDLPVHDLVREWTLMDAVTLEARLEMETLTHPMQEHTFVRYKKIYP